VCAVHTLQVPGGLLATMGLSGEEARSDWSGLRVLSGLRFSAIIPENRQVAADGVLEGDG